MYPSNTATSRHCLPDARPAGSDEMAAVLTDSEKGMGEKKG